MPGAIELPRTTEKLNIIPYARKSTAPIFALVQSERRMRGERAARRGDGRRRTGASTVAVFAAVAGGTHVERPGARATSGALGSAAAGAVDSSGASAVLEVEAEGAEFGPRVAGEDMLA